MGYRSDASPDDCDDLNLRLDGQFQDVGNRDRGHAVAITVVGTDLNCRTHSDALHPGLWLGATPLP